MICHSLTLFRRQWVAKSFLCAFKRLETFINGYKRVQDFNSIKVLHLANKSESASE